MEKIMDKVIRWAAQRGWNKKELARQLNVESQYVTNWIKRGLPTHRYADVAKLFGRPIEDLFRDDINADRLATGEGEMLPAHGLIREPSNIEPGPEIKGRGRYPVLSDVQAGNWREVCVDTHDPDEWGVSHHNLGECGYMLRVSGNSMTNTESGARFSFPEGMLLHVNPHAEALPGKFVIVRRESEKAVTFKRLQIMDGELYLEAINPSWPTRYIRLRPGDQICGVVVDASFGGLP
jgi:SOS-response transcriptional repressor LexA